MLPLFHIDGQVQCMGAEGTKGLSFPAVVMQASHLYALLSDALLEVALGNGR